LSTVALLFFYLITPLVIIYFTTKSPIAQKIGSVLIAYVIGLIAGNMGIFADNAIDVQNILTTISVPIALPLLLFSIQIKTLIKRMAGTMLSFILGIFSLLLPIFIGFFIFNNHIEDTWKISGMLTGVYTGGTPNLAAIKLALDVDQETYILAHSYDMILSAFFLLFVMSIGKTLLGKFLKPYKSTSQVQDSFQQNNSKKSLWDEIRNKKNLKNLTLALTVSIFIFAIGGGLSMLVPENASMAVAILTITTLGIICSTIPKINKIPYTFDLGMFFILIFSLVVASMADFSNIGFEQLHLLSYITLCVLGSFIIHILLAKAFGLDAHNVIIVSTALACSPPFVPVVAGALRNKEIIASGLTVGIIGYAIGNYLGISIAWILQTF
jgi:uncharacterized membrane protein